MLRLAFFCFFLMVVFPCDAQPVTDPRLETVAVFGQAQPIGVSVSSTNRVFVSFPRREPYQFGLTEIKKGERLPFPDRAWNEAHAGAVNSFVNVQDIYVDAADQLWLLDSKPAAGNSVFGKSPDAPAQGRFNLIQIDLSTNKVVRQYGFEDLDKSRSGLNDVRVDTQRKLAYLSDPGQAGIVVLDLTTGKSRLVLANTAYSKADTNLVLTYEGRAMEDKTGKPFMSNINGIALTKDNRYFYFKPINQTHLYRIETRYLADGALTADELAARVEDMGQTAVTHGLVADKHGNIYLTSSLDYSIKRWSPDGKIETIVQDPRLIWPDSLGIGSDGYLYFSCAQVNRLPQWNNGEDRTSYPYAVYRIKIL